MRKTFITAAGLALALSLFATASAAPSPHEKLNVPTAGKAKCADRSVPGGEWPSYEQNLFNTRAQDAEKKIDASNVASLTAKWTFSAMDEGGTGSFETTPVVAEGCVYMTTGSGYIYAINADTGALVWKGRYAKTVKGVCCGSTLFAPTVDHGVLYELVSRNSATAGKGKGPYAIAVDAHTGKLLWQSKSVETIPGAYTNASTVLYKGLIFFGISGAEGGNQNAGGYAILDAKTGKILVHVHTVPTRLVEKGYGGGSIWSTAAVDTNTGYAYAGTGQPTTPNREYHLVDAILKIDLDRDRPTFGRIVDAYKGTPDSRAYNTPACQDGPSDASAATCAYTDVDFAASPTLLHDSLGRQIVVETQKSGDLHAAYTDEMEAAWIAKVAPTGTYLGTYASTSTDGKSIYAAGNYPGQVFSLNRDYGGYNWVAPAPSSFGANPTTYANGLVYHADAKGIFYAFDAATGTALVSRPMQADTGGQCLNTGGGVAVARETVYAVCGERGATLFGPTDVDTGWVIAYRLPN